MITNIKHALAQDVWKVCRIWRFCFNYKHF